MTRGRERAPAPELRGASFAHNMLLKVPPMTGTSVVMAFGENWRCGMKLRLMCLKSLALLVAQDYLQADHPSWLPFATDSAGG